MKTPTCSLRDTQTLSIAEFLQELHCTLLLATGRDAHLTLLGADQDGLIRRRTGMTGIKCASNQGEHIAVWGTRRLAQLSRGSLLSGKKMGTLARLLLFGKKKSACKPDNFGAMQWGQAGLCP